MKQPTILLALLALALTTTAAMAEQRALAGSGKDPANTFYDSRGNRIGTSSTDSQGTTTTYDARGNVTSRATTSGNQTTVYDAAGRNVGRFTTERRP